VRRAAARAGKPVGDCGEAAADPALAPVLAGPGVTGLSMSARGAWPVREELARHTIADCERLAAQALEARDAPRRPRDHAPRPLKPPTTRRLEVKPQPAPPDRATVPAD
jgi:phosphoenolpyruvate-protein kinase (PTS system EI component)